MPENQWDRFTKSQFYWLETKKLVFYASRMNFRSQTADFTSPYTRYMTPPVRTTPRPMYIQGKRCTDIGTVSHGRLTSVNHFIDGQTPWTESMTLVETGARVCACAPDSRMASGSKNSESLSLFRGGPMRRGAVVLTGKLTGAPECRANPTKVIAASLKYHPCLVHLR